MVSVIAVLACLFCLLVIFWIIIRLKPVILLRSLMPSDLSETKNEGAVVQSAIKVAPPYQLVKARHGVMLANKNDIYQGAALVEYGEASEHESEFLCKLLSFRPGVVVDVGANIGTHTVPLARILANSQRQLIAFEPQPFVFQNLCANVALNGLTNVRAWPWACGARKGTVHLHLPNYFSPGNFTDVPMSEKAVNAGLAVPCVKLDDVIGTETVSLIKIDVSGFELAVLQGAVDTLARSRPILYVADEKMEKSQVLVDWLLSKNYRLWWHIPLLFNDENFFGKSDNMFGAAGSINILAIPKELDIPVDQLEEITDSDRYPRINVNAAAG
jgi:FkbM family methyltransferase